MTRRVRFEKRVAGVCERYELLEGVSPLHTSTGSGQGMDATCTRLTARPAANGLAARSTITLTYFSRSCMLEDAMLVCFEGCPEYPALEFSGNVWETAQTDCKDQ